MTRYIAEIMNEGDVSRIDEFIHPDIEFPQANIRGIDQFGEASVVVDTQRREQHESFDYDAVAILGSDTQGLAYAIFRQVTGNAESESRLFWYAELEDGLIRLLEAGAD
jgi:hypothetical protein